MDENPETPSAVAATIGVSPWSVACVTMWKIGPECAAQHAKCVNAIIQNCGVASTSPAEYAWPPAGAAPPSAAAPRSAGSRISRATGMITSHARSPRTSSAMRQSAQLVSARASGAITRMPMPIPADTSATASPRRAVNHLVAVEVNGA